MNGYELSRIWYAFKFENINRVKHVHSDMYFYLIDLWNRLGQKSEFGLPTQITMELLGIGSYNTYKATLNDLINFGFIKLISDSKNQHQSKVIALSFFDKALDKAIDKATVKANDEPTDKALDTIIEQGNIGTKEQENNNIYIAEIEKLKSELDALKKEKEKSSAKKEKEIPSQAEFMEFAKSVVENELKYPFENYQFVILSKYESWVDAGWKDGNKQPIVNWKSKFKNTLPHLKPIQNNGGHSNSQQAGTNSTSKMPFGSKLLLADPEKVIANVRAIRKAEGF